MLHRILETDVPAEVGSVGQEPNSTCVESNNTYVLDPGSSHHGGFLSSQEEAGV